MIEFLSNLGRASATLLLSAASTLAAVAIGLVTARGLNFIGFSIDPGATAAIIAPVTLAISAGLGWVLLGWLFDSRRETQKMREIASADSLTGLQSRYAFFENAAKYISLANRNDTVFSVMLIDLDHFKAINDRYGHPAGDAVLRLFADVVNSVARHSDIIGRLGGEEFAILLPDTGAAKARGFAERLHAAIAKAVVKTDDALIHYTASIGVASATPPAPAELEELLNRADLALYRAKREGRNRTALFEAAPRQAKAG